MDASAEMAQQSVRDMGVAAERSGQDMREMGAAVTQFSDQARRMDVAAEQAAQGVREYGQSAQRAADETVTMRSSVGASANNLGFEFVQAAQDAKFGAAGVANQIPLMSEQFAQLTAKTGTTTGALRALGSSLLGPVGVVGAVTLLISYQEEISNFFSSSAESADEATESFQGFFRETEQGLSNLDQLQSELEAVGGSVGIFSTLWVDMRRSVAGWRDLLIGRSEQSILGGLGALAGQLNEVSQELSIGRRVFGNFLAHASRRWEESQLTTRTEQLREALSETTPAALIAQDRLNSLGVDVETIVSGSFAEARAEVKRFREELGALSFGGLLGEDPATAAQQARREFRQVSQEALRMTAVPGFGEQDLVEERVNFLERTLEQAAAALSPEEYQQHFGDLAQTLSDLRQQLDDTGESAEGAGDDSTTAIEEQQTSISELENTLERLRTPEGNRLARLKDQKEELQGQVERARLLNRLEEGLVFPGLQQRARQAREVQGADTTRVGQQPFGGIMGGPGIPGSFELAGSNRELGRTGLPGQESGEPSGLEAMNMSLDEIQDKFNVSEEDARQFRQTAQSEFAQVIGAAGQLGSALGAAFDKGRKGATDIAAILMQSIGGFLSAIAPTTAGLSAIPGAALAAGGGIVGSFQHGGTMPRAGAAQVHPPEFVMAGGGTQIVGQRETEEIIRSAAGQVSGADPVVRKLDEVARRVEDISLNVDTYRLVSEINRIQTEKDEFRPT